MSNGKINYKWPFSIAILTQPEGMSGGELPKISTCHGENIHLQAQGSHGPTKL